MPMELTLIRTIYDVANAIYKQVEKVNANQRQCTRLADRVHVTMSTLGELEKSIQNPKAIKRSYMEPLMQLKECLEGCSEFIEQFIETKWFRRVLKAGNYQTEFANLNQQLADTISQLGLGLNTQQMLDHTQDQEDRQQDQAALIENQKLIIDLNIKEQQQQVKLASDLAERDKVLNAQIASLQSQFKQIVAPKAVKPLIDPKLLIPYFDLTIDKLLKKSSSGSVYKGRWHEQKVAIKMIEGDMTEAQDNQFVREIQIMDNLRNSPHVIPLYGACLEKGRACLVTEYMKQGSLYNLLKTNRSIVFNTTPKRLMFDVRLIACTLAKGLDYIHRKNVIHRDFRSGNVLLDKFSRPRLTDFGLSQIHSQSIKTAVERIQPIEWMAPELLEANARGTRQSDIYSFGMVLWELITGEQPYARYENKSNRTALIIQDIKAGKREEIPAYVDETLADLIRGCWEADPRKRPSMEQIIQTLKSIPKVESLYIQAQMHELAKNDMQAFNCYLHAAKLGYAIAQYKVANYYRQGDAIAKDKTQTQLWLLKASQQGYMSAQFNLGYMLEKGDGVSINKEHALYWYQQAAAQGDKDAQARFEKLQKELSASPQRTPPERQKAPIGSPALHRKTDEAKLPKIKEAMGRPASPAFRHS